MTSRFAFLRKQSLVDLLRFLVSVSASKALRSAFCTVQANFADVFGPPSLPLLFIFHSLHIGTVIFSFNRHYLLHSLILDVVLRYLLEHEFNALTPIDDSEYLLSLEVLQSCVLIDSVTSKPYALKKVFSFSSRFNKF